jgi:ergothioneine biosynthesis protein EgtB
MATPMADTSAAALSDRFRAVREQTLLLIRELRPEDTVIQTMPDVSPTKWHLAHVTWFFEHFVLMPNLKNYSVFDEAFHYLFNSYYYTVGDMHSRPQRGLLSRPTLAQVLDYRSYVDTAMQQLLQTDNANETLHQLVTLGLQHEQQHQELLLTDIKHVFGSNPLRPIVSRSLAKRPSSRIGTYSFAKGPTGIHEVGASGDGFAFDNETPRHSTLLHPHEIGQRLVSNGEYREFIRDGGYETCELWLSDGWAAVNEHGWRRPLYWDEDLEREFTLGGDSEIDDNAPVCHVSFYEADAFARWAGARLPTEFEWEVAAERMSRRGNFLESDYWHPVASDGEQFFGDVWEWTSSSYAPYPGFKPLEGSLGEYNGKFMCNQMTVRGGSCVTSKDHIRASYRSFFYPDARWQFLGIRLAKDSHDN